MTMHHLSAGAKFLYPLKEPSHCLFVWGFPALSNRKYFEPMQSGKQQTTSSTDFYFYFSGVITFSFKALQSRQSADGFGSSSR